MELTLGADAAYQLLITLAEALQEANDPATADASTVTVHVPDTIRDAITESNNSLADDSTRGVIPPPPPPPFPFPLLITLAKALQAARNTTAADGPTVSVSVPDAVRNAMADSLQADDSTRGNPQPPQPPQP